MDDRKPLLLLGMQHPHKGVARIERWSPQVAAAITAGDGTPRLAKRDANEDSLAVLPLEGGGVAAAVADAHFGATAGELAVRAFADHCAAGCATDAVALAALLIDIDTAVRAGRPAGDRSETTVLLAVVRGAVLAWASVGDSRLFLLRSGAPPMQLAAANGVFAGGGLPLSLLRERGLVGRAEGVLDAGTLEMQPGDVALLATDGIDRAVSGVDAAQIAALLGRTAPLEVRVRDLVHEAGCAPRGGRDNLALVAIELQPQPPAGSA